MILQRHLDVPPSVHLSLLLEVDVLLEIEPPVFLRVRISQLVKTRIFLLELIARCRCAVLAGGLVNRKTSVNLEGGGVAIKSMYFAIP